MISLRLTTGATRLPGPNGSTLPPPAISMPLTGWPFSRFTREDYTELYTGLYDGTLRVERYSDLATLPETPNVAVNVVN